MSEFAATSDHALDDSTSGWSIPALVVGIGLVAIAVSGLLDDSGLAEHPHWVVPAAAFLSGCFAIVARTLQQLVRPGV